MTTSRNLENMTFPETVQAAHTSSDPWQPQMWLCPLFLTGPDWDLCSFSSRVEDAGTGPLLPAASRPATPPRRTIRNPIRPGFYRPPRSRSGDWRRRGLRGPGGGWGGGRTAHARRRGRGLLAPPALSGRNPSAAAPPGAARSPPRPDPRRPGGACFLGPRPRLAAVKEHSWLSPPGCARSRSSPAACFPPQ